MQKIARKSAENRIKNVFLHWKLPKSSFLWVLTVKVTFWVQKLRKMSLIDTKPDTNWKLSILDYLRLKIVDFKCFPAIRSTFSQQKSLKTAQNRIN